MISAKERIMQLLDYYNLNANQFSTQIKVKPQNIYDILYGKTKNISLKLADSIKAEHPLVKTEWLLAGRGPMHDGLSYEETPSETDGRGAEDAERYDVEKTEVIDSGELKRCKIFSNVFCTNMKPLIDVGDQLLVSRWEESFISWGKVYILTTKKGNNVIAYLFPSKRQGFYVCRSADPENIPESEVACDEVKELYLVLGRLTIF